MQRMKWVTVGSKSHAGRRKEDHSPQHIVQLQHVILPRLDKVLHAEVLTELLAPRDIVCWSRGVSLLNSPTAVSDPKSYPRWHQ